MNKFLNMTLREFELYRIKRNIDALFGYFSVQTRAITICYENKLFNPVLILIYTTIDTLSYLSRKDDNETVKKRFTNWVDDYLLDGDTNLKCSSLDLYAARCGIVHSTTAESNLTKIGKAKQIFYSHGKEDKMTDILEKSGQKGIVVVKMPDLFMGLQKAFEKFIKHIRNTDEIFNIIERIEKVLHESDKEEFEILQMKYNNE